MPKLTVLDMVQHVLSDMDEDEVNSIDDTLVSMQVARILKDTYYSLINERLWPQHENLGTLVAVGNLDYPTHLKLPENTYRIDWLKYNTKDEMSDATGLEQYEDVRYLEPDAFVDRLYQRNASDSNIKVVIDNLSMSDVRLLVQTDKDPEWWTSFDDEYIICDSYDSTYDDTLQEQKTLARMFREPSWTMSDTFTPDLPMKGFSLLLSETKKAAAIKLRQANDPVEVERARRQRTWMAGEKHRTRNKGINYPNYGRK